jgi:hypothetical protein
MIKHRPLMANFINRKMSPFSFIFFFFQLPWRLLFIRFAKIPQSPRSPRYTAAAQEEDCPAAAWNMDDVRTQQQTIHRDAAEQWLSIS